MYVDKPAGISVHHRCVASTKAVRNHLIVPLGTGVTDNCEPACGC